MKTDHAKAKKYRNLIKAYISSHINGTPAFVRLIPTDRCNLNCAYCWQMDNQSPEMTRNEFRSYVDKAYDLHVGIITLLGGEPMQWDGIYDGIAHCTRRGILTDMTTNGTLLNDKTIRKLGEAGLDYLNVSVDGLKPTSESRKNALARASLIEKLKQARERFGMHFRMNAVMYKDNFEDIQELMDFAHSNQIQLSLGYIVPPPPQFSEYASDIYFGLDDTGRLNEMVRYILEKKREGYPIIDPDAYFQNIFRFLNRERFWECNYPTRYGWINVTPSGKIRSCTKKMDELDIDFLSLDVPGILSLRSDLKEKVRECNVDCYSNCAYDSYFYMQHKREMAKKIVKRIALRRRQP